MLCNKVKKIELLNRFKKKILKNMKKIIVINNIYC